MNKIIKETEFHDKRFREEIRQSTWKFYSVEGASRKYFYEKIAKNSVDRRILEIGSGKDLYSLELNTSAKTITAIDISSVAVDYSQKIINKKNLQLQIKYQVMNAEELNFPSNSFDFVFGSSIIHHLDIHLFLKQLSKVLSHEGKAVFIEPLSHNIFIKLYRKLTPKLRTEDEHPLIKSDLQIFSHYFEEVELRFFHLLTLLAVPFRNTSFFSIVLKYCENMDHFLFRIPFFRNIAWQVVIELKHPIKENINNESPKN